jgi:hypothetical protein
VLIFVEIFFFFDSRVAACINAVNLVVSVYYKTRQAVTGVPGYPVALVTYDLV